MNNRIAFIDFVRGLLQINPLERWSPQQAKLHPFITQQKFTGQFVPPMNLKSSALNRSPAPGTQQQMQAEALCRQRAQAAQAAAEAAAAAQAATAAAAANNGQPPVYGPPIPSQFPAHLIPGSYQQQQPNTQPPPPYTSGVSSSVQQQPSGNSYVPPAQMPPANYAQSSAVNASLYPPASANRGTRPRASTMEQQQSGIPPAIQRVASQLDPNHPIRLQPSPAYYPPPPESFAAGGSGVVGVDSGRQIPGRRGSRTQANALRGRDFIRTLEERTLEEGWGNPSGGGGSYY